MEFKDLVTLYFERSNAYETLWGFYITVVLGLLAYFGSAKQSPQKTLLALIVSVGFIGFAYVNGTALYEVAQVRIGTQQQIAKFTDTKEPANQPMIEAIKKTIKPTSLPWLTGFHVAADVMVLIGLWTLTSTKT